jgi:Fur family ferric uptake transcriptional regulator
MNEALENMLTAKRVNPPAMRLLVLEYLLKQTAAVSLQDLEKDFQHSDRITLYRTLKTFEEKGLVHPITDGTGTTKYALCSDACTDGEHYDLHLHFYCTGCQQTFCLPKTRVPDIRLPNRFVLEELNLTARGICDRCSQEQCN